MNPYELYPTPQEVDAWTDEIWAAAQAPYTVAEEPLPETYIGPLQAMGADRFLRFETGGDFFYALFQPALGGPRPLVVHTPGYGSEISLHPEIAFAGYNVLHIQPMGYMSPSGRNEERCGPNRTWPVMPDTIRTGARGGYKTFLAQGAMAVRWALSRPECLPDRVSFFGTSQGGGGSLLLGSVFAGRGCRCVAADQPFLTDLPRLQAMAGTAAIYREAMDEVGEERAWRAQGLVDSLSHVHRLTMPVWLGAAGRDEAIPPAAVESLFRRLTGTKCYMYLAPSGHGHTREFTRLAAAWFDLYA